jgi:hypothetical protein
MKPPFSDSASEASDASIRIGPGVGEIRQAFLDNLVCGMGRLPATETRKTKLRTPRQRKEST